MKKNVFLTFTLVTLFLINAPCSFAEPEENIETELLKEVNAKNFVTANSLLTAIIENVEQGKRGPNQEIRDHNSLPIYLPRNPLSICVELGNEEGLIKLLEKGGSPNLSEPQNDTALDLAISLGKSKIVQLFLNYLKDEDLNNHNKSGKTLLHHASCLGQVEIVSKLLDYEKTDVNNKSGAGNTAFHDVITSVKIFKDTEYTDLHEERTNNFLIIASAFLQRQDMNLNATNLHNQPLLHYAIEKHQLEIAQMLINDQRIDLTKQNGESKTALELAEEQENSWNNSDCKKIAQIIRERQKQDIINFPAPSSSGQNHSDAKHGCLKENKKSSFFIGLFRSMITPFRFVGQKGINLLSTLGALRNFFPAKSLFNWLFFLKR